MALLQAVSLMLGTLLTKEGRFWTFKFFFSFSCCGLLVEMCTGMGQPNITGSQIMIVWSWNAWTPS